MDENERHVGLGIAWAHYTLGYITSDELDKLQELLGFTDDDMDTLGI